MNLGRSFAPTGAEDAQNETRPAGSVSPAQEALRVISLNMPSFLGARSLGPKRIIGAQPGSGRPVGADPQQLNVPGRMDPNALVLQALLKTEMGGMDQIAAAMQEALRPKTPAPMPPQTPQAPVIIPGGTEGPETTQNFTKGMYDQGNENPAVQHSTETRDVFGEVMRRPGRDRG
jgi:hypothetical protein